MHKDMAELIRDCSIGVDINVCSIFSSSELCQLFDSS